MWLTRWDLTMFVYTNIVIGIVIIIIVSVIIVGIYISVGIENFNNIDNKKTSFDNNNTLYQKNNSLHTNTNNTLGGNTFEDEGRGK